MINYLQQAPCLQQPAPPPCNKTQIPVLVRWLLLMVQRLQLQCDCSCSANAETNRGGALLLLTHCSYGTLRSNTARKASAVRDRGYSCDTNGTRSPFRFVARSRAECCNSVAWHATKMVSVVQCKLVQAGSENQFKLLQKHLQMHSKILANASIMVGKNTHTQKCEVQLQLTWDAHWSSCFILGTATVLTPSSDRRTISPARQPMRVRP
jgi:hypothetical protein